MIQTWEINRQYLLTFKLQKQNHFAFPSKQNSTSRKFPSGLTCTSYFIGMLIGTLLTTAKDGKTKDVYQ